MSEDLWESYTRSWRLSLRAANRSPRTVETYMLAVKQFMEYLGASGIEVAPTKVERAHIESFVAHVLDTRSAATARQRHQSLRGFFVYLAEEEGVENPMAKMRPPKVEEKPAPVLARSQLSAILATTSGKSFDDRRDRAIIRILIDTGVRASELIGLTVDDVSLEPGCIWVKGKGAEYRSVPLGHRAVQDLDRYLRVRSHHQRAMGTRALFIGARGPTTRSGLGQIVSKRGRQAGIANVHPHLFRHSFVHHWLADGGQEGDGAQLLGWSRKSAAQLMQRYAASTANERAHSAHGEFGMGDRL